MVSYQGNADFIAMCFAMKNRLLASKIINRLQKEQLRVWVADKGFSVQRKEDLERLAVCRTALILVSKQWLADELCTGQLKAAAALERQAVLLFLDESELTGNDAVQAMLPRSAHLLSYSADSEEWLKELLSLECITDCKYGAGEDPQTKKVSLWSLFRR